MAQLDIDQFGTFLGVRLVERLFNLVGSNFSLMRNLAAPAAPILSSLGKIDMLEDCRTMLWVIELDSLNYSVAAPQALDHFSKLTSARAGDFANHLGEFRQNSSALTGH